MRRGPKSLLILGLAVLTVGVPAATAQNGVIGTGVTAGGVDLSGLTVEAAAAKLQQALGPGVSAPVLVGAGGRAFRLSSAAARVEFDALTTAKRADRATAPGPVPLALRHSRLAVRAFVAGIGRTVDRPARNARVHITTRRIFRLVGRDGHALDQAVLSEQLDMAFNTPGSDRVFHVRLVRRAPRIGVRQLASVYPTIVTIDRGHFRLRLFKRLRLARSYPIAVGRVGLATPAGLYHVQEREVNPSWHVPNSPWAGALAGRTIPPGPNDPIVARWLGLGGGVGIHGTRESFSIGSRASHGCIRMLVRDVIRLYPLVPLGTPVYIS